MAAVRKHEGRPFAHDLRGFVHTLPGRYMVGGAGNHIAVGFYLAHIDRLVVQRELSGADERVAEIEIEVIAMQSCRKSGRVGLSRSLMVVKVSNGQ